MKMCVKGGSNGDKSGYRSEITGKGIGGQWFKNQKGNCQFGFTGI